MAVMLQGRVFEKFTAQPPNQCVFTFVSRAIVFEAGDYLRLFRVSKAFYMALHTPKISN